MELDEIKEGLEDASKLHPTHKDVPVAEMIKSKLDVPLAELEKAIEAKDKGRFTRAFDGLTGRATRVTRRPPTALSRCNGQPQLR